MAEPDNAHQPTAQKASEGPSIPQSQATPLLTSFTTFLTLAIHSLLYHRQLRQLWLLQLPLRVSTYGTTW